MKMASIEVKSAVASIVLSYKMTSSMPNLPGTVGWINFDFLDNFKLPHVACAQGGCKNHL